MQKQKSKIHNLYLIGVLWFLSSLVISCLNDVLAKYLCCNLHPWQTAFLRFFFGTITLIPFMLYYGKGAFKTTRIAMHFTRGTILFFAIFFWTYGIKIMPIATVTVMSFTVPIFILLLAPIFLYEKVALHLWVATIIGFIGVIFALHPGDLNFNYESLVLLLSALLFATLDVINKKFVAKETMLSMLFYSTFVTTILAIFPALKHWQPLSLQELFLFFLLGSGSNFILFCILNAFKYVEASSLAPFRYTELIISIALGYIVFQEIPQINTYIGSIIIIPCSLYIAYNRAKSESNKKTVLSEEKVK